MICPDLQGVFFEQQALKAFGAVEASDGSDCGNRSKVARLSAVPLLTCNRACRMQATAAGRSRSSGRHRLTSCLQVMRFTEAGYGSLRLQVQTSQ